MDKKPLLRVFNKIDRFPDSDLLAALCQRYSAVAISAIQPETLPGLLEKLESYIQ
jgi:GTP-binding protein HflX